MLLQYEILSYHHNLLKYTFLRVEVYIELLWFVDDYEIAVLESLEGPSWFWEIISLLISILKKIPNKNTLIAHYA